MPIRAGVAAFRSSPPPPNLDRIRKLLGQLRTILSGDVFCPTIPRSSFSLSASAITFNGYASMARKEDAARCTRQGNGRNGEWQRSPDRREGYAMWATPAPILPPAEQSEAVGGTKIAVPIRVTTKPMLKVRSREGTTAT